MYVVELSFDVSCSVEFDWWGGPQFLNKRQLRSVPGLPGRGHEDIFYSKRLDAFLCILLR